MGSTTASYSTGERSQTDGIEERDLSGNYNFYKYGFSVKAEPSKDFVYRVAFKDYEKDFESSYDSLDNRTNYYDASFSMPLHKTDTYMIRLNTDYQLMTKRYKNSPNSEYDKNSISGGLDLDIGKDYSLEISAGIKDYDYIKKSSSDQLKTFIKIAPDIKLYKGYLTVSGYYRKDWVDQTKNKSQKDYTEDTLSIRPVVKFDFPSFYELRGFFGYGRNDTRDDDEDREDNLRYEYKRWDLTSCHKLANIVDTQFTYGQKYRDYFTSLNSYDNWYIENKTKVELLKKDPFNMDLLFGGDHKETDFFENYSLCYIKNSLFGGFNVLKREDWSFKPNFAFIKYDYPPLSTKNERQYKLDLSCKKYIGSTDKALEAGYSYKWKDYKYKPDITQWSLNLAFEFRF
jgi:hypothetical protein